jgi:hypothetical protein
MTACHLLYCVSQFSDQIVIYLEPLGLREQFGHIHKLVIYHHSKRVRRP